MIDPDAAEPATPPLGAVIALDLAAAYLAPAGGAAFVLGRERRLCEAASRWLAAPVAGDAAGGAAARVLVLWPGGAGEVEAAVDRLAPGGRLSLLTAGRLAPLFARLRRGPTPPALPRGVDLLARRGLAVELSCGVAGPTSPVLAALARAAALAERPDLADRFELAYRRALIPRPGARSAEILVLGARRP